MLIVADENIPAVEQAFSSIGSVRLVNGRNIIPVDLEGADALLVRSITRVNAALLGASSIKFVGTATSGVDHIDQSHLHERNITFANAAGANAQAVTDYIFTALLELCSRTQASLNGQTLGVIGYGNVGKCVARLAEKLGMTVLINDPPLQLAGRHPHVSFVDLQELLRQADIISLHIPLTTGQVHATQQMVNEYFLSATKANSWFVNSSRGGVVDEEALLKHQQSGRITVLDVWQNEPGISMELLKHATIATPHVAGYSQDAKISATFKLYQAVCEKFDKALSWQPESPALDPIDCSERGQSVNEIVKRAYNIMADDIELRKIIELPVEKRASYFDRLRSEYEFRREFSAWHCYRPKDEETIAILEALGFGLIDQ